MKRSANAYAKINLYLDIVSRRENGYHDIKGIMQKISLCDTVTVTLSPAKQNEIHVTCTNPNIPTDRKNIAYKAAEAYLDTYCDDCFRVDIDIVKRIPAAGGLAGGSTDAAAVLSIMRELLGKSADTQELMSVASELGADVPFCLARGSMITEGIGDVLTPTASLDGCYILITNTGESVSTPLAYAKLDEIYDSFRETRFDTERFDVLCSSLKEKDLIKTGSSMYNVFENIVLGDCPLAAHAKEIISEGGSVGAMMSGSGPTVFGLFESKEAAENVYKTLTELGYSTHICTPVK